MESNKKKQCVTMFIYREIYIKTIREVSQIAIIISGRDSLEDQLRCLNLRADGYMTMPFKRSYLAAWNRYFVEGDTPPNSGNP